MPESNSPIPRAEKVAQSWGFRTEYGKKIVAFFFLVAMGAAVGHAQESRQDISISGIGLSGAFIASAKDGRAEVGANRAFGALASYR